MASLYVRYPAAGTTVSLPVSPANGGTGVANNASSTLTISGAFGTTLTVTATTAITLPTTGTLATLAGSETLTNKTISGANNTITGITPAGGGTGVANNNASTLTISGSFGTTLTVTATTAITLPTTGTLATLAGSEVLTNKTISGASNTISGITPAGGGTGVANNNASTLTISGSFALTLTLTNTTGVTLPTTGTLSTLAGSESLTNKTINTGSNSIVGVITVSNASAGNLGEYVSDAGGGVAISGASTQYFDLTSISLTAGDWDLTGGVVYDGTGSVLTVANLGISVTTGNSATGLVLGVNQVVVVGTLSTLVSQVLPRVRINVNTTTTVYLKGNCTYASTAPTALYGISARRVR